ncbi:MAG: hypothetical protein OEX00_02265 [Gammaproteobacteria bacterium]|nr:hypothetical protein [Gammaproteobacteria bacterium]
MSLINKLLTDLEKDEHPAQNTNEVLSSGMRPVSKRARDPFIVYHIRSLSAFFFVFGLVFVGSYSLYELYKTKPSVDRQAAESSSALLIERKETPLPIVEAKPIVEEKPAPVASKKREVPKPEASKPNVNEPVVQTTEIQKPKPKLAIRQHQNSPEQLAESMYIKAKGLRLQGRMVEAEAAYNSALAYNPRHLSARGELIQYLYDSNRWMEALNNITTGLGFHPANQDMLLWRAHILYEQGVKQQALDALMSLPRGRINNPDYLAMLALLQHEEKSFREAAESYRLALEKRPTEGKWWMGMGVSLESAGDLRAAKDAYIKALSDPSLVLHLSQFTQQRLARLRNLN